METTKEVTTNMKRNMGTIDRIVRTFVLTPGAIVGAVVVGPATAGGIVLWVVAAIMLGTGASGFCPLYVPFGIDTQHGLHKAGPKGHKDSERAAIRHAA
ncbi:MAG: DUF2892 domain-containing protein [Actinobacteria bacterium]|jgi:hypothetical protein|nr:DUF2892 domain-containing protein [Actinomycetota bacterium]